MTFPTAEPRTIFERWAILTSDGRIAVDGNGLCIFNSAEAAHKWIVRDDYLHRVNRCNNFRVARVRLVELAEGTKGERT